MRGVKTNQRKIEVISPELKQLITNLVERRKELSLSQVDIAEMSGLGTGYINRFEQYKIFNPTVFSIERYAEAVKTTLYFLLDTN